MVRLHPEWDVPIGVRRFHDLLEAKYDGARFFRFVPKFIVQFGLAADPTLTARWKDRPLQDDALETAQFGGSSPGNVAQTLTYATSGANTRTTQMFFDLADNAHLGAQDVTGLHSDRARGGGVALRRVDLRRVRRAAAARPHHL